MTYYSKAAAKRVANKEVKPVVYKLRNGRYDWWPKDWPIGHWNGCVFVKEKNAKALEVFENGEWRKM